MRSYISYDELEELGETIVRAYINKTRRYNALCVDIEGLVTDYLGLTVVYETIVEDDLNKIAFLSNGCNKDTKENRYPHRAKAILHCR